MAKAELLRKFARSLLRSAKVGLFNGFIAIRDMNYSLSFERASEQLVRVSLTDLSTTDSPVLELARWRPGRYEAQRYDRNIADVEARSPQGTPLPVKRLGSHSWQIGVAAGQAYEVSYLYYTNQPDAGGSYVDADGVYINPINLLLFDPQTQHNPSQLHLALPGGYQIACSMRQEGYTLFARDYHELVDSPLMAAPDLLHHAFDCTNLRVHLWFMGECRPNLEQIEAHVRAYSEAQIAMFGSCPVDEYHYLCYMLPNTFRHGLEHQRSTVLAMGPGYMLNQDTNTPFYRSFLELCSHEFFHTWNVKYIRPAEMFPYRYDRETYSAMHYVTEGVTTFYGDLMLWKGGIWDDTTWMSSINEQLNMFYRTGGKNKTTLEAASIESWVRGYSADGIPNRKVSFYTKGYLVAMLLDFEIRRLSGNSGSLDRVMRKLYTEIAQQGRGYTAADFRQFAEEEAGQSLENFFSGFVSGLRPFEPTLQAMSAYFGLSYRDTYLRHAAAIYGMKVTPMGLIENILEGSPAQAAGLARGDEIVAVGGIRVENNLNDLLNYHDRGDGAPIHFFHRRQLKTTILHKTDQFRVLIPQVTLDAAASAEALANRAAWYSLPI